MPPPAPLRLTQAMRVKQGREFQLAKTRGQRLVRGCLIANWVPLPAGSLPRLGVITSSKLGNAVIRSRARRLLREVFRLHQHELREPLLLILIARNSIVGKALSAVERDYLAVLRQAGLGKTNA